MGPEDAAEMQPVLVIASAASHRAWLAGVLEGAALRRVEAGSGADAIQLLAAEQPGLVLLDLAVRDMNGHALLRRIRMLSDVPVIAVSRGGSELEAIRALRAGADDVVVETVPASVLLARIEALLRRAGRPTIQTVLRHGELEIDLAAVTARVYGRPLALPPLQFRLLATLVRHAGRVLPPDRLLALVWGDAAEDGDIRVKVAISALRRRLRQAGVELPLKTIRGFGYSLAASPAPSSPSPHQAAPGPATVHAAPGPAAPPADVLPIGWLTVDRQGIIRAANPAAHRLLGYGDGELTAQAVTDVLPEVRGWQVEKGMDTLPVSWVPANTPVQARDTTARRRDGASLPVELSWHVDAQAGDDVAHAFLLDATARKASEARVHHMALHDELTGLANRASFTDRVRSARDSQRRGGDPCAIFLVDLDRFTLVNETLGPAAGDDLLRECAWRLRACVRPSDTVARFGGDEFALLCHGVRTPGQAAALVGRIERALSRPFLSGERRHVISATIGCALSVTDPSLEAEMLVRRAHTALYRAKDRGRTRFEMFEPQMQARAARAFDLQHRLRGTLDSARGELSLAYQPIVALRDGRLSGFEALLRWRSAGEEVSPAEFIPIAEATELIVPMGAWVVEQAVDQLAQWQRLAGAPELSVAVNLSPRQLIDARLMPRVARALDRSGIEPASLVLEITETALMRDVDDALAALAGLRELGVRMMLDDFGTGYSSLAHVVRFPIDGLKIDREFIERIGTDPGSRAIVDSVVGLARGLGAAVVAEGIETPAQCEFARRAGCQYGQGYFFGTPTGPQEAAARLSSGAGRSERDEPEARASAS